MKKIIALMIVTIMIISAWYWFFGTPEVRFVAGRCIDHGKIYKKNETWEKRQKDNVGETQYWYTCRGNNVSIIPGFSL